MRMKTHPYLLCFFVCAWAASPAWAYLDPGTGSYIFQILIGTLFGLTYALRTQLRRLLAWLTGRGKCEKVP